MERHADSAIVNYVASLLNNTTQPFIQVTEVHALYIIDKYKEGIVNSGGGTEGGRYKQQ